MPNVIFSMGLSLDGFVNGPDGGIDWSVPDEELHRFHNERVAELSAHFLGRRIYEVMLYWETADQDPEADPIELEFAQIWQALPKVVFSTTLDTVQGNTRLATRGIAEEVVALKQQAGGDLGVGGATLAGAFTELGLIDEYQLFIHPVVLGGGTPFFPALENRFDLELVETRTFSSRVVYLNYRRTR